MSAIFRSFALLMALVCVGSLLANSAEAQVGRALSRHLGVGYGNGYHTKTPLTDSSYYNPYSNLNSNYYGAHAGVWNQSYSSGFGSYSSFGAAQFGAYGASYYPGARVPNNYLDRPLPKWHGTTRSNLFRF